MKRENYVIAWKNLVSSESNVEIILVSRKLAQLSPSKKTVILPSVKLSHSFSLNI
jgi:hypothetical protein